MRSYHFMTLSLKVDRAFPLSDAVTSSMRFYGCTISSGPHLSFLLLTTEMDLNLSGGIFLINRTIYNS